MVGQEVKPRTFGERCLDLLKIVEVRRADTDAEKNEIYELRYEAYRREGVIEPRASGSFNDPGDLLPNVWQMAVYLDGELISSIRLHIGFQPSDYFPGSAIFGDIIKPMLQSGKGIVEATRHISRLKYSKIFPHLPFVTMRAVFLATEYFNADYAIAGLRKEYVPVYRRMYDAKIWSEERPYPPLTRLQTLVAYDVKDSETRVQTRLPFHVSTEAERERLFRRSSTCDADMRAQFARRNEPEKAATEPSLALI